MDEKKKVDLVLNRFFWLSLAIIAVLPLIGILNLNGMFSLELSPGGKAIQTIAYKTAGSELSFEVRGIEGLKDLTVTFLKDVKNMAIEFEEIDSLNWEFKGTVYSRFKVFSEDEEHVGEIKFNLKLKEKKIHDLGLAKGEIRLYVDGRELETKLTDLKGDYVYYKAFSSQMGEFVIGKAAPKAEKKVVAGKAAEVPEEAEPEIVEEPIIEQPAPAEKSLLSKIISFFKGLFS